VLIGVSFLLVGWAVYEKIFLQITTENIMKKGSLVIAFSIFASIIKDYIIFSKKEKGGKI